MSLLKFSLHITKPEQTHLPNYTRQHLRELPLVYWWEKEISFTDLLGK